MNVCLLTQMRVKKIFLHWYLRRQAAHGGPPSPDDQGRCWPQLSCLFSRCFFGEVSWEAAHVIGKSLSRRARDSSSNTISVRDDFKHEYTFITFLKFSWTELFRSLCLLERIYHMQKEAIIWNFLDDFKIDMSLKKLIQDSFWRLRKQAHFSLTISYCST